MKRIKQFSIWIIALMGLMTANNPAWAKDTTPPMPGGYQSGYPKATGPTTIEVKWKRGSDNVTTQANLRYMVGWTKKSEDNWQNSHPEPYPKDMTAYTITGLEPNTEYLVDVLVVDEAGNKTWYDTQTVTTGIPDNTKPTAGGYQSGYPKATDPTAIEVKWKRGSDNVTAPANLRYVVAWTKKSEDNWQNSHPWPFTNYPKDMTSYTLTGLEPNTEYVVDVLVVDEAVNFQWYGQKTVKTPAAGDTQYPTPGGYQSGYPKAISAAEIEVRWKRATDNVTAPANLRYRMRWKKKSGGSWLYSHHGHFTNWPKDWTAITLTGLEPNTEYLVDVVVVDEAENWAWYGEKTVKTQAGGAADKTSPTPGGYQSGYPKATGPTTIEVKWKRGSDNVTTQADLRYQVFCSKAGSSFQLKSGKLKDTYSHTF
ncbi:fibronectin type III domain-containing protein, partial [Tannerella forsythia]